MGNIQMFRKYLIFGFYLALATACTQQGKRVDLGSLQNGATVSFVYDSGNGWGIEIYNGKVLYLTQGKPAQIEVFQGNETVSVSLQQVTSP